MGQETWWGKRESNEEEVAVGGQRVTQWWERREVGKEAWGKKEVGRGEEWRQRQEGWCGEELRSGRKWPTALWQAGKEEAGLQPGEQQAGRGGHDAPGARLLRTQWR